MNKYKNKYRIKSHRKPNWDYSSNGYYFLTICTQHMKCNLGKIVKTPDNKPIMILSEFGKIVEKEWHKSFEIRKELKLREFVIMPNHLHAIVEIDNPPANAQTQPYGHMALNSSAQPHGRASLLNSSAQTHGRASLDSSEFIPQQPTTSELSTIKRNPPIRLPKSISSFLAGFKSAVNTKIDDYIDEHQLKIPKYNRNNHFFQPNYHDHIIRNHIEYRNIANYINNNPAKWIEDKFHISK